jgi:hypothetical protein
LLHAFFVSTAPDRDTLHRLIDALRPEDVPTAQRVLQALNTSGDPLLAALAGAQLDDEAETESEREAVDRARREIASARTLSHEDVGRKIRHS